MPEGTTAIGPKRRGRPPKEEIQVEPLTPSTAERFLKEILGEKRVEIALGEGDYERLLERYRPMMEETLRWEAQPKCPHCQARPGYNPITGVHVQSWDQATRSYINGHRQNCITLAKAPR